MPRARTSRKRPTDRLVHATGRSAFTHRYARGNGSVRRLQSRFDQSRARIDLQFANDPLICAPRGRQGRFARRQRRHSPIRAYLPRKQPEFANRLETATVLIAKGADEPRRNAAHDSRSVDPLGAALLRKSVAINRLVYAEAELFLARILCRISRRFGLRLPPGSHPIKRDR